MSQAADIRIEAFVAALLVERRDLDTAGVLLTHALGEITRHKPDGDPDRAEAESVYGAYLAARGHTAEAETCLRDSLRILEEALGAGVETTRRARRRLAALGETRQLEPQ
ncbi:MAG: hypothetical protein V3T72_00225 [Thermoanaerobaculia bacterium]